MSRLADRIAEDRADAQALPDDELGDELRRTRAELATARAVAHRLASWMMALESEILERGAAVDVDVDRPGEPR